MDWETPLDAWYTFLAVSLVSVAVAGVVLSLPSGPPPDANQAANTIEPVAGSTTETSATWTYDAETIAIDGTTVEMENEHGTTHASMAYGVVVPLNDSERLENITRGAAFEDEYEDELADGDTHAVETFLSEVRAQYETNSGTPLTASGELVVRQLSVDPERDRLAPLVETVDLETTISELSIGGIGYTGIGAVQASYDGVAGNGIELSLDGNYVGPDNTSISDADTDRVFSDGEGELEGDIESSHLSRPAAAPVDVTIAFDDGETCERTVGLNSEPTCTNLLPRSVGFDDDEPFVEYKEATESYHVTLVVV
ncbi:DUF7283 family protein [Natronorubrum bangense]|uniref:Uncharacterized protein n=2 Tax=Natronorubrum bangense TaxID=61858 RepID=L9WTY0_9EURY|nr:hypothetical protein [Natronorubrum bangense]ELY52661.1 hypothetical protein C494_00427 [Natronorubrum bangense JCM 10635]QCC55119.1 hypothetical protein DV706_11945 [Natronorubrum bangense]